jgi:uncharacterized protein (TIGR00251 family)
MYYDDDTITITLYTQPGAKSSKIAGHHDGKIKIALQAPPNDNQANKALVAFLAKRLNTCKSAITVVKGHKSRFKVVRIKGDTALLQRCTGLLIYHPH